jgi:hypothetical protein
MKCPKCGTENDAGFRFCIKCGTALSNPQDVNIEQIDMGGYYSEDDPVSGGFTFSSGTFKINDTPSHNYSSDLYTADELNEQEENSSFDEPFIPKLDTGRVTLPEQSRAVRQAHMQNAHNGYTPQNGMPMQSLMHGMPNQGIVQGAPAQGGGMPSMSNQGLFQGMPNQGMMHGLQPHNGMQSMPNQGLMQSLSPNGNMQPAPQQGMMQGISPHNNSQMNSMPMYGKPMMYAQPPVTGYDQNGMPMYGQPMMYGQPPIVGYDQNGMPVYGQPMMYGQPPVVGYDQNGMPVYGQPTAYGQPHGEAPEPIKQNPKPVPPPVEDKEKVKVPDDFWEFFDGGKATEHAEADSPDDFFGKRGDEIEGMKRFEKKGNPYMNDTPLVDASKLRKNEPAKFNKMYMKSADVVNPNALESKKDAKHIDYMRSTKSVDASDLRANTEHKSWNIMTKAEEANYRDLQLNKTKHNSALMAQADHAVEAMPKKAKTYNDEIDAIELPEEMQAKKTKNTVEIPGLPEI